MDILRLGVNADLMTLLFTGMSEMHPFSATFWNSNCNLLF